MDKYRDDLLKLEDIKNLNDEMILKNYSYCLMVKPPSTFLHGLELDRYKLLIELRM